MRAHPCSGGCADNQDVVNRSGTVIIAVRLQDHSEALAGLQVGSDSVVVSVMAGIGSSELRQTLGTDAPLVRAIPLPAVRERRSVTVTFPSHPVVDALFDVTSEEVGAEAVAEPCGCRCT
ncbi:NAD(P)-binding domain-containing protein [Streptomyces sp. NPDC048506]|uniref:NAD(P)-binding domain-containing protein n=1 Tax=Streptomyces sp. NPDC048506 TaxID=3155028 RepID=UPI003413BD21